MLDIELFGMNPGLHHLVNVLFHLFNTLLLYFVMKRMTKALWQSAFVAALFALHPLHVESVVWIAERKDVLYGFFWMLTMWSYVLYVEKPGWKRYLPVVLFLVLGLLSKPMLVTLPFVLLLLDYWPLKRFDFASGYKIPFRFILEKVPLFLIVFFSCVITYIGQKHGEAMSSFYIAPLSIRISNVIVSYVAYLGKMVWPLNLTIFYPYPEKILLLKTLVALFLLILITVLVVRKLKGSPYLAVGWFWYLGTLVPVNGLVKLGGFSMADRFSYIPLIGIFMTIAWGVPELLKNWQHKAKFLSFSAGAVLLILTALAWVQTSYWKNSVLLFGHALRVTRNNYIAHNILGSDLVGKGLFKEASSHFKRSLEIWPQQTMIRSNLAFTLIQLGREDEAIAHLKKILKTDKSNYFAHLNMGIAFAKKRNFNEAVYHFQEVLKINPDDWAAHRFLGFSLKDLGREKEAVYHLREALRINPSDQIAERELRKIQGE